VSHAVRRTFMGNGSDVSRGDRNRNARLKRLRALVPVSNAIAGIDLAAKKQMVVVCDQLFPCGSCHADEVPAHRKTQMCRSTVTVNGLGSELMRAAISCGMMWRALGPMDTSAVRSAWSRLSW